MKTNKCDCCGWDNEGYQHEPFCSSLNNMPQTTDNCYLEYDEDGYLVCSYNHKMGEECLMKK